MAAAKYFMEREEQSFPLKEKHSLWGAFLIHFKKAKGRWVMTEFIIKYWLEVLFGLMVAGLGAGYRNLASRLKEQEAIKLGIQALLRDRIIQAYNHYLEKGYCPIYARQNIEALFVQYQALGGNGVIANLVEHLKDLPTEWEEK